MDAQSLKERRISAENDVGLTAQSVLIVNGVVRTV